MLCHTALSTSTKVPRGFSSKVGSTNKIIAERRPGSEVGGFRTSHPGPAHGPSGLSVEGGRLSGRGRAAGWGRHGHPEAALCQAGDGHAASAVGETMGPASAGHLARRPGSRGGVGLQAHAGARGAPPRLLSDPPLPKPFTGPETPTLKPPAGTHALHPVPDPQCPKTPGLRKRPGHTASLATDQRALQKQFRHRLQPHRQLMNHSGDKAPCAPASGTPHQ